ncbi:MAG: hypothetical protein IJ092_06965 [Atopobiaceae bacterium]|nr:hypothetical protein [Atopobiaceae bacterium]
MADTPMRDAVERSIKAASEGGALDLERHAAPIAMLRHMADFLDGSGPNGTPAMRYATPASFLSYCDALGLLPEKGEQPKEPAKRGTLGDLRGKFKQSGKSE